MTWPCPQWKPGLTQVEGDKTLTVQGKVTGRAPFPLLWEQGTAWVMKGDMVI